MFAWDHATPPPTSHKGAPERHSSTRRRMRTVGGPAHFHRRDRFVPRALRSCVGRTGGRASGALGRPNGGTGGRARCVRGGDRLDSERWAALRGTTEEAGASCGTCASCCSSRIMRCAAHCASCGSSRITRFLRIMRFLPHHAVPAHHALPAQNAVGGRS